MIQTIEAGKPVAPGIAWTGLAVTGLAAVAGGLSLQSHGLAGSDLGGALRLSADEASWVTTAGSVAEGVAVLIAAQLTGAFGIRRIVAGASLVISVMALVMKVSPRDLETSIGIRALEGFACGLLPVVMMVWSMRAFPPPSRALPLMLFAFCSSFPSALAPLVAGTATDHLGGSGVFLLDLVWPLAICLVSLLTLPHERAAPERLLALDWPGFLLLGGGVAMLLIAVTQGERRFWLETHWIAPLLAGSILLLALGVVRLLTAKAPYFDLGLLTKTTFAIGMAEALSLRFALLMASFAVPQALARLQGFRIEQSGETIIWLAAGQLIGFPLAWLWLDKRDGRWALGLGLASFAGAAMLSSLVTPAWSGEQFAAAMVLAGFGQGFFLTSVVTFATYDIPPPAGATAAGLFNLTRVIGTAGATAAVGYFLRIRENYHSARLVEAVTSRNDAANLRLDDLTRTYNAITPDAGAAQGAALSALAKEATGQAFTLAFSDVFLTIAVILVIFTLLLPILPRLPLNAPPVAPGAARP
ncbi:MAG: MFS transporter [Beijerinckiaceae bacterium]|nr:MFS transporter [Beijerinckiaceae bacterium]